MLSFFTCKSSIKIEELHTGTGPEAKAGDILKMHYSGTLENGNKFDSSYDRGTPFEFKLGAGQVIRGWDEGIAGMRVGGKRKLVIPYDMAYGAQGRPPVIPAKATLVFEVELVEIIGK